MALKAGREGVASSQVDEFGNILPSPEAYTLDDESKYGVKNLAQNYKANSKVEQGITFTVDKVNGIIDADGTSTAASGSTSELSF